MTGNKIILESLEKTSISQFLHYYEQFNALPCLQFKRLRKLAALISGTQVALISLTEETHSALISAGAIEVTSRYKKFSLWRLTSRKRVFFEISDFQHDKRFEKVLSEGLPFKLNYLAAFPIKDTNGKVLGHLSLLDQLARGLNPEQRNAIQVLTDEIATKIASFADASREIPRNGIVRTSAWCLKLPEYELSCDIPMKNVLGLPIEGSLNYHDFLYAFKNPDARNAIANNVKDSIENRKSWSIYTSTFTPGALKLWLRISGSTKIKQGECVGIDGRFEIMAHPNTNDTKKDRIEADEASFISNIPVAAAMFDLNMRYIQATQDWIDAFQIDNNMLTQKFYYDHFGELSELQSREIQRALEGEHVRWETLEFESEHGERKYFTWRIRRWKRDDGEVGGLIAMVEDLTASVKQTERLQPESEESVSILNRKSFLAKMSHEFRTPLNAIMGFAELMQGASLSDTQMQYLKIISHSASNLLNMINDILDFSKIDAGKLPLNLSRIDLFQLCTEVTEMLSLESNRRNIELLLAIDPDLPKFVITDNLRLRQVLINLLANALKFTEEGEVELEVKLLKKESEKQNLIRFSVRDTGIGIMPENQKKIFEAFTQEDDSVSHKYGGTGLGLTIANRIMSLMNSSLKLYSLPGAGSVFYFDVSLECEQNSILIKEKCDTIPSVLITDDNERNRLIIKDLLSEMGVNCREADSGEEALACLSTEVPELIIIDYHMSGMNGLDCLRDMKRSLKKGMPWVIFLCEASDLEEVRSQSTSLNIKYTLTKPVNILSLHEAICSVKKGNQSIQQVEDAVVPDLMSVLIADDNSINLLLSSTIVKNLFPGVKIIQVNNGLMAVEECKKKMPDIIFMDIQMPQMDGIEASRLIRILPGGESVLLIALTAGNEKLDQLNNQDLGIDDVLLKPFSQDSMRNVVNRLIAKKGDRGR